MRLAELNRDFKILARKPPAEQSEIAIMLERFPSVPNEYLELADDATELELQYGDRYLRIWNPATCVDMDEGYEISQRLSGSIPVGDDGGGRVIFYYNGKKGWGLYRAGFGNLDPDDVVCVATNLKELLGGGTSIKNL